MNQGTFILWGTAHSLYTGKLRSYLRKKGLAFVERNPSDPEFGQRIVPTVRHMVVPVLETPQGEVLQAGTPEALYERPSHSFVGRFIGSPGMNFLPCALEGGEIRFDGGRLPAPGIAVPGAAKLMLGLRPQAIRPAAAPTGIEADLIEVEDRGSYRIADLALGANRIKMHLPEDIALPAGRFPLAFRPSSTLVYADDQLVGDLAHA